jgi:hypothetical protein
MDKSAQRFADEHLKVLLNARENEKRIKSIKPYPRTTKQAFMLKMRHQLACQNAMQVKLRTGANKKDTMFSFTHSVSAKHSCMKKVEDLKPIKLSQMKVNQVHFDTFLVCKTIVEPFSKTYI